LYPSDPLTEMRWSGVSGVVALLLCFSFFLFLGVGIFFCGPVKRWGGFVGGVPGGRRSGGVWVGV